MAVYLNYLYPNDAHVPAGSPSCTAVWVENAFVKGYEYLSCSQPFTLTARWNGQVYGSTATWYQQRTVDPEKEKPPADDCSETCGNPIAFVSGRKLQTEEDYRGATLSFVRTYNSGSPLHDNVMLGAPLGPKWRHNYQSNLTIDTDNNRVIARRGFQGVVYFYPKSGSATQWISDADNNDLLESLSNNTWRYTTASNVVELYDDDGRIISSTTPNGYAISYAYDDDHLLDSVTDSFNRRLQFTYDDASRKLTRIVLPSNETIQYAYDSAGNLSQVVFQDGTNKQYQYVSRTVNGQLDGSFLSAMIDESGISFVQWDYDSNGLATSSEHAGGTERYTIQYQVDEKNKPSVATVIDPLGSASRYTITRVLDVPRTTHEARLFDSKSRQKQFDGNGNLVSTGNFSGVLTNFSYDLTSNLETSRTIAAGTSQAKTVSTEWHAVLREPIKIIEPGKVTTFTYDANGNRLTQTVSASGISRTWSWTYTPLGQVATATQPDGQVTTYAYDAQGNLASITNGHLE